jgi:predicted transcriptional regulator
VFCDGAINYFSFSECLSELISTGHIMKERGKYEITQKGREDGAMIETSLPISVRDNADMGMLPVAERISREAMIHTSYRKEASGAVVHLTLSDGKGIIFDMSALAGDEAQAKMIEKKFRLNAEEYYIRILNMFMEE